MPGLRDLLDGRPASSTKAGIQGKSPPASVPKMSMQRACIVIICRSMSKPLQIRNVPDDVLDALRRKAQEAGLSLTAYARRVLEREAKRPALAEVLNRPGGLAPGVTAKQLAELIREDRDTR